MDPMPLAGVFCTTLEEAREAPRYPLTWTRCGACSLVQVLEDVDDDVLFQTYNYASSTVPGLVKHFEAYAAWLAERFGRGPVRLLEIGCNDGVLLRRLPDAYRTVGVDPSDVARKAPPGPYELVNAPFTAEASGGLPGAGEYDVVTASNCLAHIADLRDVFVGVHEALRPDGAFLIEVHDLEATLGSGQWDTIYHEHKAEWSIGALQTCLAGVGFALESVERPPLHGGLLRACFRKAAGAVRQAGSERLAFDRLIAAYRDRRATDVYRAVRAAVDRGEDIAAYGAAGRANVWLNQLPELPFRYIVDDSPLRSGRWLPGVGTPVVRSATFEADPPRVCLITAWNYARDIVAKHPSVAVQWLQTFTGAG
jgi:methylation protein EvaC